MISQKEIKQKINSTSSINKITQAMQMVATSKSKKAIKDLHSYKEYYLTLKSIAATINSVIDSNKQYNAIYWIVISSDLGLSGSYNHSIIKETKNVLQNTDKLLVIGNKAKPLMRKNNDDKLISLETIEKDSTFFWESIEEIINFSQDNNFMIKVIYTKYYSQLEYKPKIISLIPAELEANEDIRIYKQMEFEPSAEIVQRNIENLYVQGVLLGLYKESITSENTARRIAMENATKNSEDMLKDLKIKFNRSRQQKITEQISEIIGGAEAQK